MRLIGMVSVVGRSIMIEELLWSGQALAQTPPPTAPADQKNPDQTQRRSAPAPSANEPVTKAPVSSDQPAGQAPSSNAPAAQPSGSPNPPAAQNGLHHPPSADDICQAIEQDAAENQLPVEFFARVIWQESRFNARAVSSKGAQGIAQFMPQTAEFRGLADPFEPVAALREAASYLGELERQFGNLGLAAAAYNAGPGRVTTWLAGERTLPA